MLDFKILFSGSFDTGTCEIKALNRKAKKQFFNKYRTVINQPKGFKTVSFLKQNNYNMEIKFV